MYYNILNVLAIFITTKPNIYMHVVSLLLRLLSEMLHVPSAFVLSELKFHESKQRVETKLDQSEVPAKRLESIHRKYQLLWKIGHKSGSAHLDGGMGVGVTIHHAFLHRNRLIENITVSSIATFFHLLEGNRRQGKR